MPMYRFQCGACGLNFSARSDSKALERKCDCGKSAKRILPTTVNISVSGNVKTLSPTSTTGLSGVDYNYDRAVGETARQNWRGIAARQKDKLGVIQATGASGFDLSRQVDGTYRVMPKEERLASERSRQFHFKVMDHIKKVEGK